MRIRWELKEEEISTCLAFVADKERKITKFKSTVTNFILYLKTNRLQ